jgi:hypothetical protein
MRHNIDGHWYDAPTYAAAREMHRQAQAPAQPVVAPVVPPPALVVFTVTVTPSDNFAGRSLTRFGVGEDLSLGFTTNPVRTAASFGGLTWAIKSGGTNATLTNSGANDGVARLVMNETAGTVVLELRTLTVPPVVKATKTLWVVEPTGAVIVRKPNTSITHTQNTASAGFWGQIHVHPTDVSFHRCEMREGSAPIRATGSMATSVSTTAPTSASTGQRAATQSELNSLAGARHPVMGGWSRLLTGNSAAGSRLNGYDNIQSIRMNPPYVAGTFDWDIDWYFRVQGSRTEKKFVTVTHSEAVTATGAMTISKGGYSYTAQAADATTSKNNPPPP